MTTFTCRQCRTLHEAEKAKAGTAFVCYLCGEVMHVSTKVRGETRVEPASTVVDKLSVKVARPAVAAPEKVCGKIRCTDCGARLTVRARVGKNVQCPLCTGWFRFMPEAVAVNA